MLKKLSVAIAAASSVALGGVAMAETFPSPVGEFDVSMTATLASDYVSRGRSLNDGPTVQASLDIAHESGLYIGAWGSNLATGAENGDAEGGNAEFDYYIGFAGDITKDVSFDLSVATYTYPDTGWDDEYEALASVSAYGATLGVKHLFEPADLKALYTYAGYDYALPGDIGLSATVGQTDFDDETDTDYVDWSLGLSKTLIGLDFAVVYSSTDLEDAEDNYTFSVSKTF